MGGVVTMAFIGVFVFGVIVGFLACALLGDDRDESDPDQTGES